MAATTDLTFNSDIHTDWAGAMYKSVSFDPLCGIDVHTEHLTEGGWLAKLSTGEITSTCDALGVKREYSREAITGRLMIKRFGTWSKPENARLDAQGTLFYSNGDVENEERLNGVHIQSNRKTGVVIQTDHVNRIELVKQANGELWKRHTDEHKELFEMWMNGKLSFRSETIFQPTRMEAATPGGVQALVYVSRSEQSWASGTLTRERFAFKNPLNNHREVTLSLPVPGSMLMLKNVVSVTTTFDQNGPVETTYELKGPTRLRVDFNGSRRELTDITKVRQMVAGGKQSFVFTSKSGNDEHVLTP